MTENVEAFWDALGRLTYAETLEIAIQLRDVTDPEDFALADAYDWAKLLNSAREAATYEEVAA